MKKPFYTEKCPPYPLGRINVIVNPKAFIWLLQGVNESYLEILSPPPEWML